MLGHQNLTQALHFHYKEEKTMEYSIDRKRRTITLVEKNNVIVLPILKFDEIANNTAKELYFREDVINAISERVKSGLLPKWAKKNNAYIDAVNEKYAEYRWIEGDSPESMNWIECLNQAFDETDYETFR